jgi:hypothetical protein
MSFTPPPPITPLIIARTSERMCTRNLPPPQTIEQISLYCADVIMSALSVYTRLVCRSLIKSL